MNDITPTKKELFAALTEVRGRARGNVVYLAAELGICPQAISRWKSNNPIPRVHSLHLCLNRPDVIGLIPQDASSIETA